MPMMHARRFIRQALNDDTLRKRLNKAPDEGARELVLSEAGYTFSPGDFDEAMRSLEVQCQSLEQHQQLQDLGLWWGLLWQD